MELEELLDLMRTASERYKTVRAALRYRGDGSTIRAIEERIARSEGGRVAFAVPNQELTEPVEHWIPDSPFGWRSRVWHDDKKRWRIEVNYPAVVWRSRPRRVPGGYREGGRSVKNVSATSE